MNTKFLTEIWVPFDTSSSLGEFPEHFGDSEKEVKVGQFQMSKNTVAICILFLLHTHTHTYTCISTHIRMYNVCITFIYVWTQSIFLEIRHNLNTLWRVFDLKKHYAILHGKKKFSPFLVFLVNSEFLIWVDVQQCILLDHVM